ncbi:hypothetical protein ACOXXX_19800 [Thalassococcus sp. BH17M4-6]|uniref:hypothetical protein n=1 Tax=Thalassococcus sp. BH17M4-6 TaxID=3413148 RepID=UPI003BDC7D98
MSKKVLLAATAPKDMTPRLLRFAGALGESGYTVYTATYSPSDKYNISILPRNISNRPLRRQLERYSYFSSYLPDIGSFRDKLSEWRHGLDLFEAALEKSEFDAIIVHDYELLPVAVKKSGAAKVILDAREYYPAQVEDSYYFRRYESPERIRLLSRWLPQADGLIATSNGHADEYSRVFGVNFKVIQSASSYREIPIREKNDQTIRLVHHGVSSKNRKLEKLVRLIDLLPQNFTLDLYLVFSNEQRRTYFAELCDGNPRVTLHNPIPFQEIVPTMSQYDIGLCYFEPTTFNLMTTMPNKFFEYIQARLPVAIGPSTSMKEVVDEYGCGVVSPEFSIESLASTLSQIGIEELQELKAKSDAVARVLNAENEANKLIDLIDDLLAT